MEYEILRNSALTQRKGTVKVYNDYGDECVLSVSQEGMTVVDDFSAEAGNNVSSDSIFVSWGHHARVLSYNIYRSRSIDGLRTLVAEGIVGKSWEDVAVIPGESYFYWVEAVNEAGAKLSGSVIGMRSIKLEPSIYSKVHLAAMNEFTIGVDCNREWSADV
jgi:hypothetical protein